MLIIIFMFLLVISFAELLGIMDPAQRYCAFLDIFAFLGKASFIILDILAIGKNLII